MWWDTGTSGLLPGRSSFQAHLTLRFNWRWMLCVWIPVDLEWSATELKRDLWVYPDTLAIGCLLGQSLLNRRTRLEYKCDENIAEMYLPKLHEVSKNSKRWEWSCANVIRNQLLANRRGMLTTSDLLKPNTFLLQWTKGKIMALMSE